MERKFEANADHYNSDLLRMAYVEGRVQGDAAKHLKARSQKDAIDRFTTAEEMLIVLNEVYGNKNRLEEARREY